MPNTSRKSSLGLYLLFAVASIVFLVMWLLRMKKKQSQRPQRNNNPFALIQTNPSNWAGLIGQDSGTPSGFLSFDSPVNGTRAGFINLWNRYFSKGLRSINRIAPVYEGSSSTIAFGPGGVSAADKNTDAWAVGVSKISGYDLNDDLTWAQAYKLGRAIETFENGGRWVSDADFLKGYQLATTYTKAK